MLFPLPHSCFLGCFSLLSCASRQPIYIYNLHVPPPTPTLAFWVVSACLCAFLGNLCVPPSCFLGCFSLPLCASRQPLSIYKYNLHVPPPTPTLVFWVVSAGLCVFLGDLYNLCVTPPTPILLFSLSPCLCVLLLGSLYMCFF